MIRLTAGELSRAATATATHLGAQRKSRCCDVSRIIWHGLLIVVVVIIKLKETADVTLVGADR